jgi:hypothetical protein
MIDGIFDALERKSLRIPKNVEDGFQGKIQFPGEFKRIRSPALYPAELRARAAIYLKPSGFSCKFFIFIMLLFERQYIIK